MQVLVNANYLVAALAKQAVKPFPYLFTGQAGAELRIPGCEPERVLVDGRPDHGHRCDRVRCRHRFEALLWKVRALHDGLESQSPIIRPRIFGEAPTLKLKERLERQGT